MLEVEESRLYLAPPQISFPCEHECSAKSASSWLALKEETSRSGSDENACLGLILLNGCFQIQVMVTVWRLTEKTLNCICPMCSALSRDS